MRKHFAYSKRFTIEGEDGAQRYRVLPNETMICECPNPLPCNCHQCTWLRANQFERAFIPRPLLEPYVCKCGMILRWPEEKEKHKCPTRKPQGETGKCGARPINGKDWCNCSEHLGKPADPVEEKIKEILANSDWAQNWLPERLRELVSLVRKEDAALGKIEEKR